MSESVTIGVDGMKCGGCENNIKLKLSALEGVAQVDASHNDKQVTVLYDPQLVAVEDIEDAIEAAGFSLL
jgi:copper chaperone